jgi:stage III sporulation protein AG
VIITDGNRNQKPVISQVIPAKYLGAVIICQGADQPTVRLAIVEAVSKLTGLGTDRVCVLKMK